MTFYEMLKGYGLQVGYMVLAEQPKFPFLIYLGAGQSTTYADNAAIYKDNQYSIEYYYKTKDEVSEKSFEDYLTSQGVAYTKSMDVYIEAENIYVIYYEVTRWLTST